MKRAKPKKKQKRFKLRKIAARKKTKKPSSPISAGLKDKITSAAITPGKSRQVISAGLPSAVPVPVELPSRYNRDKLTLIIRDPEWLYAYWEITPLTLEKMKNDLGRDFAGAKRTLRLYDVTKADPGSSQVDRFHDILINDYADNWYINIDIPDRSWRLDLGFILANGQFVPILSSNTVHTPETGPSPDSDPEWMSPQKEFMQLYDRGFGPGPASLRENALQEKTKHQVSSQMYR